MRVLGILGNSRSEGNTGIQIGECQIKDDMEMVYQKLLEADGIVVGTPVYFWNPSSLAKVFIDRGVAYFWKRRLANKVVGAIAVAGRRGASNLELRPDEIAMRGIVE